MKTFDKKTGQGRYMTNNEIDKNKKKILENRLMWINHTISQINFKRSIYGYDFLSTEYNKLISQKEKIESMLNYSEK